MTTDYAPSSINILIVDDELSVRESLQSWFTEDGYSVDVAEHATAALAKLPERAWDIILLDIKMPGMDGLTLLEKIHDQLPDIIVIIITAFASIDTAVEAMRLGAYEYQVKPVIHEEIKAIVKRALDERSSDKA